MDAAVGCDDYKRNLASLQWAAERSQRISGEAQAKILRLRDIDGFHKARRHAYGRLSSVIDQISPQIIWLGDARNILRKLPSIDPSEPCIVVAGSPNVGKSALIRGTIQRRATSCVLPIHHQAIARGSLHAPEEGIPDGGYSGTSGPANG